MNQTPADHSGDISLIFTTVWDTPLVVIVTRPHPDYAFVASIFRLGPPDSTAGLPETIGCGARTPERGRVLWAVGPSPEAAIEQALGDLKERSPDERWNRMTDPAPGEPAAMLSSQQHIIASLIAADYSDADIAAYLYRATGTISHQVRDILSRLRFRSRAQIAAYIARQEVLETLAGRRDEEYGGRATDVTPMTRPVLNTRLSKVATFIAEGLTNGQIAFRLECSEATVHTYVHQILETLRCKSRKEIAAYVRESAHDPDGDD